jgi:hypothetical protein
MTSGPMQRDPLELLELVEEDLRFRAELLRPRAEETRP